MSRSWKISSFAEVHSMNDDGQRLVRKTYLDKMVGRLGALSKGTCVFGILACSMLTCSMLVFSTSANAQSHPGFDLVPDESRSSTGFELYGGFNSAATGGSQRSGDPLSGVLGAHLLTDWWAWSETPALATQNDVLDNEASFALWPLSGTRWGLEGAASFGGYLRDCLSCGDDLSATEPSGLQASQSLRLRSGFFNIVQTAHYQRPSEYDDVFWRADRNLASLGFGAELPFLVRFEDSDGNNADIFTVSVHGRQLLGLGARSEYADREYNFSAALFEFGQEYQEWTFSCVAGEVSDTSFAVPDIEGSAAAVSGPSALRLAILDCRGLPIEDSNHTYGFRVGHHALEPGQVSSETDGVANDSEPSEIRPELTLRLASTDRTRRGVRGRHKVWRALDHVSYQLQAGTFHRIGPTGFGVDEGWKLQLDAAVALGERWLLHGEAAGVTAQRVETGQVPATFDLAPVGSEFLMGRAEVGATHQFGERLVLDLVLWGERSDRYDPRPEGFSEATSTELIFRMGAAASLTARVF